MTSIKDFNCKASASVKTKSDGTNLPNDELNNFFGEMLLFYQGNLLIENKYRNKHVFKATLHLDITDSQDVQEFIKGYCDHNNNKTIKLSSLRHNFHFS